MSDANATPEIADNEATYDQQIFPLMAQILDICKANKIPMVASFEYAPEELCTSIILPPGATAVLERAALTIRPPSGLVAFTVTSKP